MIDRLFFMIAGGLVFAAIIVLVAFALCCIGGRAFDAAPDDTDNGGL